MLHVVGQLWADGMQAAQERLLRHEAHGYTSGSWSLKQQASWQSLLRGVVLPVALLASLALAAVVLHTMAIVGVWQLNFCRSQTVHIHSGPGETCCPQFWLGQGCCPLILLTTGIVADLS